MSAPANYVIAITVLSEDRQASYARVVTLHSVNVAEAQKQIAAEMQEVADLHGLDIQI